MKTADLNKLLDNFFLYTQKLDFLHLGAQYHKEAKKTGKYISFHWWKLVRLRLIIFNKIKSLTLFVVSKHKQMWNMKVEFTHLLLSLCFWSYLPNCNVTFLHLISRSIRVKVMNYTAIPLSSFPAARRRTSCATTSRASWRTLPKWCCCSTW